jgi:uncharacterized protein YbjT (DUF2867 family)
MVARGQAVFVTGGTGYLGVPLIESLLARQFDVRALVRRGSEHRVPAGAAAVIGDALDPTTFAAAIPAEATLVHLVGTPHPNPSKVAEFQRVDLASIRATTTAARQAGVRHLIYVSVAHPAPVMKAYIAVRQQGEALVRETRIAATILRPWYVLGPGHWWPYALVPVYGLLRALPSTRDAAERLALVTHRQMVAALVGAVESPPSGSVRIVGANQICQTG